MNSITFATTNEGKLKEAQEILNIPIESIKLEVDEIQTLDPIECVEKKAIAAFQIAKKPILVEDTCLFFDAWNGLPGVFINFFMKTLDNEGMLTLLQQEKNRKAIAQTNYCFFDGKNKITTSGIIKGEISKTQKGANGFGWDTIFIPDGSDKTYAEMTNSEKNAISMRKIALEKLRRELFQ